MKNDKAIKTTHTTEVTFSIPDVHSLGELKGMKAGFSPILKYRTADDWAASKDKEVRGYFMGFKDIPNEKGEAIKCGIIVTETECFITGQMVLVDAFSHFTSGTPVAIIYRGKKANKTSEGATMLFDVMTLK